MNNEVEVSQIVFSFIQYEDEKERMKVAKDIVALFDDCLLKIVTSLVEKEGRKGNQ